MSKKEGEKSWVLRSFFSVLIIIITIIVAIAILGVKIKFALSDELNIDLTPKEAYYDVEADKNIIINFTIANNNFPQCKAICDFELTDLTNDTLVKNETIVMEHGEQLSKTYDIPSDSKQKGQVIYRYEAICRNVKTVLCPSSQEKVHESSIIFINYDLSSSSAALKMQIEERLISYEQKVTVISVLLEQNSKLLDKFHNIRFEEANIGIKNNIDLMQINLTLFREFWRYQEFKKVDEMLSDLTINKLDVLVLDAKELQMSIIKGINSYNENIKTLKEVISKHGVLDQPIIFYELENNEYNTKRLDQIDLIAKDILDSYFKMISGLDYDSDKVTMVLKSSSDKIDNITLEYSTMLNNSDFLIGYGYVLLRTKHPVDIISIQQTYDLCENMDSLIQKIDESNAFSSDIYSQLVAEDYIKSDILTAKKNIEYDALEDIKKSPNGYIANRARDASATLDHEFVYLTNHTKEELYSYAIIDKSEFINFRNDNCLIGEQTYEKAYANIDALNSVNQSSLSNINATIADINISIDYEMPEISLICCTYGVCNECCTKDSCHDDKNIYPVIFIHGHAFNEENTPEYSMNAFTKLQNRLEKNDYINGGKLDIEQDPRNIVRSEWIKSARPFTVRASYYYINHISLGKYSISAQKSEGIENYAIRLKEIIDQVKMRSGTDKVNIVAHSMGGLVTREYLDLFGYQDVDKIILITTPNKGVTGKVQKYCAILGSHKECDDMSEGSIFLGRLNAREMPNQAKIYSIRASGCLMDNGASGDGIVTLENAYLDGAKNYLINGKCNDRLQTDLHTSILDPDIYPQTYDLLVQILGE